ncbi:hypothetical protein GGI22_001146 [Coemansia erecta]|nr:hypothetical protein GGI22_001146 [Coemansia erecta]
MRNSSLLYSHQRPTYPDNPTYSPASTDVRPNTNGMAMGRTASAPAAAVIMREKQHQAGKYRQQRDDAPANSAGERLSSRNNNKNGNHSSATINSGNESNSPSMANAQPAHQNSGSAHRRSASLLGRLRHSASASPTGSPTSSEGSSRDTSRSDRTLAHSASSGSMRQRKQTPLQRTHLAFADTYAADNAKMVSRIPSAGNLGHGKPPPPQQQSRPSVRVLPPHADAVRSHEHPDNRITSSSSSSSPATKHGKKRNSLRNGDPRSASGFISQLLRGSSRSTKSSPHVASASPADSLSSRKFAENSPGTPHGPHGSSPQAFDGMAAAEYSQPPAVVVSSPHHHQHQHHYAGFSPPNVCTVEYPPICMAADAAVYTTADMHSIQCADHGPQQPGVFCMQGGNVECMDSAGIEPSPHGGVAMAASSSDMANGHPASMADFYYMQQGNNMQQGNSMLGQPPANGMAEAGDAYAQPENWYEASGPASNGGDGGMADTAQLASRLVSSLPIYEPIDLSRVQQTQHNGYARATRPLLPDARILAPMTSLAEVYSSGTADYNMLSTRELRFAVENHMLVEQHKYLIRDLGHARSAIGALKQVVQDKEDRLEQFEMANVELQQRLVLVESLLTQDQRKRIESVQYSLGPASSALSTARVDADDGASGRQAQGADYDSILSVQQDNSDESNTRSADAGGLAVKPATPSGQNMAQVGALPQRMAGPSSPTGKQGGSESSSKRNNRPLSGYTTRYALDPKPVHQLPRVFSGDYSASEVQAMEHSIEALASAIASMPADDTSVEEIIASKMAEDDQYIRDQIRADSKRAGEGGTQHVDGHGRRHARDEHAESPQEPKRRSRFLSMLRLSTFGGSSPAARDQQQQQDTSEVKHKRRSVSLGTRDPKQIHSEEANASQRSTSMAFYEANVPSARSRANSSESLAASCPTLLPGIAKAKPPHPKEQHGLQKQPSSAGSRFYPAGLGLSTEEEMGSSAGTSRQSSTKASSTMGGRTRDNSYQGLSSDNKRDRRRLSHRMSLTGQPRRSTSAPSRPHSMRVSRRKSWLFQLFSSSSSVDSNTSSENNDGDDMSDHGSVDDEGMGKRLSRRRRVLTQSSDEITQFLGRLRLDDGAGGGGGAHVGVGGVLEDVIDVSGEDEELANRASMSVAEIRQQTLDALNGTVRGSQQQQQQPSLPSLDTQIIAHGKDGSAVASTSPRPASSGPSEHGSPMSTASGVSSRRKGNPIKYDPDTNESADSSISRWRQRDASGPTIRRLDLPPPIITSSTPVEGSPSRDNASSRPTSASLGLGVSVSTRRDRTPILYLPSITHTTSHSPATPTRKEGSAEDGKSPAASANGGTPTRHVRQPSGASVQSDGSSAARKWAPAFWAPPSLNYHAGSLGSPTAAGTVASSAAVGGSSWSPRESIDSIERRPSYTRRPSEESRYLSPHGSIGFSTAVAAAAAAGNGSGGGGPSSSIGRGSNGASGSPWELVKFSETRTFPLSPSHSRPGTPTSRPLGFFEDTTVPDSDELTVAARRSLSLRMSRNAFRQVEPLPESDDVSDSLNHSENERSSKSERNFDGNEERKGKRASRIRSEGKQAAVDLLTEPSVAKQGQSKNPALLRVAGSAQNKRRSLLWQFKETKNVSATMASKPLGGQQQQQQLLARDESHQSDTSSLHVPGLSENALVPDSSEQPGGRDFERTDRPSENAGHLNGGGSVKKHRRWWSVVLG